MNYKKNDKIIQKLMNQLISEEWMASVMYKQFITAAKENEDRKQIKDLLTEISDDEMDDHFEKLVKYSLENGFDVPSQIKDYNKYASDNTVKQFNGWLKGKSAEYYINEAIKAEVEAINSYQTYMNEKDIPYEVLHLIIPNYYDEVEHLAKLKTLLLIMQTGAQYVY